MVEGRKDDDGKRLWSLVSWSSMEEIVKVLEYGAKKYAPENWRHVPDAKERYKNALLRHVIAWASGETNDPETGLSHLAHAGCCILFALWFEKQPPVPKESPTIKARMEKAFR